MLDAAAICFEATCCTCLATQVTDDEPDGCSHCGSVLILVSEIAAGCQAAVGRHWDGDG